MTGRIGIKKVIMAEYRDLSIESFFPNLGQNYKITSPQTPNYNCIAFAADDETKFWWPLSSFCFWPEGIPNSVDLDSFIACYELLGYQNCEKNSNYEEGYEKVAIFTTPYGIPTHAAKQVDDKFWKSKLGPHHDIEHLLEGLSGWTNEQSYGFVAVIMKREKKYK